MLDNILSFCAWWGFVCLVGVVCLALGYRFGWQDAKNPKVRT